jgi:hypothetical protein
MPCSKDSVSGVEVKTTMVKTTMVKMVVMGVNLIKEYHMHVVNTIMKPLCTLIYANKFF